MAGPSISYLGESAVGVPGVPGVLSAGVSTSATGVRAGDRISGGGAEVNAGGGAEVSVKFRFGG